MPRKLLFGSLCLFALIGQPRAQEVMIAREVKPQYPRAEVVIRPQDKADIHVERAIAVVQPAKPLTPEKPAVLTKPTAAPASKPAVISSTKTTVRNSQTMTVSAASSALRKEAATKPLNATSIKKETVLLAPAKPEVHAEPAVKTTSTFVAAPKQVTPTSALTTQTSALTTQTRMLGTASARPVSNHFETAFTKLADGFDFPVGKPDAQGYYKARGFRSHGHLGEDWDGVRGGDTDLGDPIHSIGDGLVVFARDCHMGWGNVIIVRHSYREGSVVRNVDALYGHLNSMLVHSGQAVARGQKIATMGNAHGLYDAHLHLEIRKNIEIGMSRAAFAQDFSNYYDPSQFILAHRHLSTSGGTYRVAMNTFVRDSNINFAKAHNYSHSHYRGGTTESAAALKKAVASQH